jgi:Ca-activated chloride channel family protein
MARRIRTASEAVVRFTRRIQENDEIFLMTFSSGPVLRQDFTGDREELSEALRHLNATGGTALYDALNQGLKKVKTGKHSKRAILLITDGQDTASTSKLNDVLRQVRQSELLIYPVGISGLTYAKGPSTLDGFPAFLPSSPQRASSDKSDTVDLNVLRTLAENSGGRAFLLAETFADRGGQIEKVLDTIADELRSQYTLGFYPSRPDDGKYRSLRVRTLTGNNVRARRGYLAITP